MNCVNVIKSYVKLFFLQLLVCLVVVTCIYIILIAKGITPLDFVLSNYIKVMLGYTFLRTVTLVAIDKSSKSEKDSFGLYAMIVGIDFLFSVGNPIAIGNVFFSISGCCIAYYIKYKRKQ